MLKGILIVSFKVLIALFHVALKSYFKRVCAQISKLTDPLIIQQYKIANSYCDERLRLYGEVRGGSKGRAVHSLQVER